MIGVVDHLARLRGDVPDLKSRRRSGIEREDRHESSRAGATQTDVDVQLARERCASFRAFSYLKAGKGAGNVEAHEVPKRAEGVLLVEQGPANLLPEGEVELTDFFRRFTSRER